MEAPKLHETTPARKPCETDVLCNCQITSQIVKMCVIMLGPKVSTPYSSSSLTLHESCDAGHLSELDKA